MNKFSSMALVAIVALLCVAAPAMAQGPGTPAGGYSPWLSLTSTFGTGLVTMGAAYGISKIASSSVESMARQPEVAGTIQVAMIIAAALIEGFTFFALYICMGGNKGVF